MVVWGGVAVALVVLVLGIVFFTGGDDKQDASVQTLPSVTLSTPSSDVPVETVAATTVAPTTVVETTLAPTTLPPATLAPTTLAPEVTVAPGPAIPTVSGEAGSLPPGTPYTEYVSITDESNLIEMRVPIEWSDTTGEYEEADLGTGTVQMSGPTLGASSDQAAWQAGWGLPGVVLRASLPAERTLDELLDFRDFTGDCTLDGRFDYDDGRNTGRFESYSNCGDAGTNFMDAFFQPANGAWTAELQIEMVTEADRAAAVTIIESIVIQPIGG